MINNIFNLLSFAEETTTTTNGWIMPVALIAIVILMFVFTIIPQRRNKKKAEEMMNNLKVGSKVTTIGGIVGTIVELKEGGDFVLSTGNSTMEFTKGAIYLVAQDNLPKQEKKEDEIEEIK